MNKKQKAEVVAVFQNRNGSGKLDYVAAWYGKSFLYMENNRQIECAFVSTNSICQGEQVAPLWKRALERGIVIHFAHQTFQWRNEARGNAAVYCVIIGFSYTEASSCTLFTYSDIRKDPLSISCDRINAYLVASSDVIVHSESKSLSAPVKMVYGNKPTDGGNLIIEANDYESFIEKQPEARPYIKRLIGSEEFLHAKKRYCLWLVHAPEAVLKLAYIAERIEKCREMRLASRDQGCRRLAVRSHLFRDTNNPEQALVIPSVSSERRKYIPLGIIGRDTIVTNLVHIVPNATLYDFAILTSAMHMTWMRTVCGRLEMRYRYSRDLCYNTFPWPTVSEAQKKAVSALADMVLNIRNMYPDKTLAEMYDPDKMPEPLADAHHNLDMAVDSLYRNTPFESDEERLGLLFKLYEKLAQ